MTTLMSSVMDTFLATYTKAKVLEEQLCMRGAKVSLLSAWHISLRQGQDPLQLFEPMHSEGLEPFALSSSIGAA